MINSVRGPLLRVSTEHNQAQNFITKNIYSLEMKVCVYSSVSTKYSQTASVICFEGLEFEGEKSEISVRIS